MRKTSEKVNHLFTKKPTLLVTDAAYKIASLRHAPDMANLIWEIKRAFERGISPESSITGAASTYFLRDCDFHPIAVFKRDDHYPREVAAYRLDHDHFAGVPQTVVTTLEHPLWGGAGTGSLQYFVSDTTPVVESRTDECEKFSAASVRRIAMLDIRLLNSDRHTSNILLAEDKTTLIPIDHGFILPIDLSEVCYDWLAWNQAKTPFNDQELSYISLLDPERDRELLLNELGLEETRANRLFIATILLKLGALRKLTPYDIGTFISRKRDLLRKEALLSRFEILVEKIKDRNPTNWTLFSRIVYEEVERALHTYEKTTPERPHAATHR